MEERFRAGGADGFNNMPPTLPGGLLATFVLWIAAQFAVATAPNRPSIMARMTILHAWMFVFLWSILHAPIAGVAHAATMLVLRRAKPSAR